MAKITKIKEKLNFEKIYFYSILLFAFTLPLSRAAVSFFVILLPIIWIFEGNLKEKFSNIKINKALFFLSIFLFISFLYIFVSDDKKIALNITRLDLYLFSSYIIYTSLKKQYIPKIINAFLFGMFISEIIAYGVYFEIWHFKNATPEYPSPFMFHIDYSIFLAVSAIILLNKIISNKYQIKEKIIYLLFFITVTGNLFISVGRTGQVAFLVAIVVMFILHFKLHIKSILASVILIFIILFSAYNLSPNFQKKVFQANNDIEKMLSKNLSSSWGIRVSYWILTYNIIKEKPFGNGLGDYVLAIKNELQRNENRYKNYKLDKKFLTTNHPHNQYLLILLQMGFIGLILFIISIYYLYKNFLAVKDEEFKQISTLFLVIYTVGFFAEPLLIKQFTLALFSLLVGLFLNAKKNL